MMILLEWKKNLYVPQFRIYNILMMSQSIKLPVRRTVGYLPLKKHFTHKRAREYATRHVRKQPNVENLKGNPEGKQLYRTPIKNAIRNERYQEKTRQ
jgi:hypothetical protein